MVSLDEIKWGGGGSGAFSKKSKYCMTAHGMNGDM